MNKIKIHPWVEPNTLHSHQRNTWKPVCPQPCRLLRVSGSDQRVSRGARRCELSYGGAHARSQGTWRWLSCAQDRGTIRWRRSRSRDVDIRRTLRVSAVNDEEKRLGWGAPGRWGWRRNVQRGCATGWREGFIEWRGGTGWSGERGSLTYFLGVAPDSCRLPSAAGLLVVEFQVFKPLGQSEFLLNGHTEKRVESLLFIFGRSQLPLHLV